MERVRRHPHLRERFEAKLNLAEGKEGEASTADAVEDLLESGHRHVIQSRLKKPGAARLPQCAHAIAQLRVTRANGHWQSLWN